MTGRTADLRVDRGSMNRRLDAASDGRSREPGDGDVSR